jgi:hypothetical protein
MLTMSLFYYRYDINEKKCIGGPVSDILAQAFMQKWNHTESNFLLDELKVCKT